MLCLFIFIFVERKGSNIINNIFLLVIILSNKNYFITERESFAEYKRRHNITQIMPDVPSTDEEESDDEAMDMLFL